MNLSKAYKTQFLVKPGSHMPLTYLGRRHGPGDLCGIYEHLSPNQNLSQALTDGFSLRS